MDLNCPKCNSENTQKITAIVDSGTTHSRGTTTSVGVGSVGGGLAYGGSTGTTRTTHTTALAQRFTKPKKRSEGYVLSSVFLTLIASWLSAALIGPIIGSKNEFVVFLEALICLVVFGRLIFRWQKNKSEKNKEYNRNSFPEEIETWSNGFFCHRCEAVFVPK